MTKVFIITASKVIDTGKASFRFMAHGPYNEFRDISNQFGVMRTRPYGKNEINLFSAVRGGPAQTAPERIELTIFAVGRGMIYHCSMDHHPGETKVIPQPDGFDGFPQEGFVLLMERRLFEDVVQPSFDAMFPNVRLTVHHHDGELQTS